MKSNQPFTFFIALAFLFALSAATSTIQLLDTKLEITIRNSLGNTVEGVEVTLYENEKNYLEQANPVAKLVTNSKGIVLFEKLRTIPYHVDARKDLMDNSEGGTKTEVMQKGKKNKTTIIILE